MEPSQLVMLPFPDTEAQEPEIPEGPISLAILMSLNPQTHMEQVFTIEAVIVYIDEAKGWYFDKCRTCHMKIEGHPHRHCQQFGTKATPNYSNGGVSAPFL